ncbi:MAG: EamA family transporter [Planctomycetes bacterium]|nr:EamA family transporter [Planctomycetota bacterium]
MITRAMTGFSLLCLLAAAVLHALANVLLKQGRDKLAFTWWILFASALVGVPLAWLRGGVDASAWSWIVASGLIEAAYFVVLGRAYSHGDLSQVYPVARGSAPLFTLVWATTLLGERPSALGLVGVATVVAGLYLINLPTLSDWRRPIAGFRSPAMRWALITGVAISVYSVVDKRGVKNVDPLAYLGLALTVAWIAITPQWLFASRRTALVDEVRSVPLGRIGGGRLVLVTAGALCGFAAYTRQMRVIPMGLLEITSENRSLGWLRCSDLGKTDFSLVPRTWTDIPRVPLRA